MTEEYQGLAQQIGADPGPEVMRLLKDDRLRSFRIDIETASTLARTSRKISGRWSN